MKKENFKSENFIRIIAGLFIFISALLGYFVSKYFLFFTMFVGLNLFQFGFTGFCPMKLILNKFGIDD